MRGSGSAKIHVWNLPLDAGNDDLRGLFRVYGEVVLAVVFKDRDLGISRCDGVVEMANVWQAECAMIALSGTDYRGKSLMMEWVPH